MDSSLQLCESRLSYFNDNARINYCKSPSVHQHGGPSRPRQNCHSCIFETKENSNLTICIQYSGHHSKTTCQKSVKSMRYRVRPKFEFYRKSLLIPCFQFLSGNFNVSLNLVAHSPCLNFDKFRDTAPLTLLFPVYDGNEQVGFNF